VAIPGRKKDPWVNVPEWASYPKSRRRSNKRLDDPTVDTLHAGTDSPGSPSFGAATKDAGAPVAEGFESSPEIAETPEIACGRIRYEEGDHSDDGNTPSLMWTLVDRD
jgi:hypothetical protein